MDNSSLRFHFKSNGLPPNVMREIKAWVDIYYIDDYFHDNEIKLFLFTLKPLTKEELISTVRSIEQE